MVPASSAPVRATPPLVSVTHVKYYDADGVLQTLPATYYDVDTRRQPGVIWWDEDYTAPTLSDEANPLDAEIQITAQPPGKQLKSINLLSGGEKTMTAIALMFAVLKTKPTPCCILDEVEAALDDTNIDIFAKYLKKFDNIQFTLITHQKATMEHADAMYGVTMPERGVSKIYSLKLEDDLFNQGLLA